MRGAIMAMAMLGGLLMASQANAGSPDIPTAYVVAAEDNGVPPEVLYAVASAESKVSLNAGIRPWPWTLNIAGESMRFGDRNSACEALLDALEQTRIVDVGIAQLNVRWQPQLFGPGKRFSDPCAGLNPYANLDEAAALIRGHYEDTGDWLIAAGRYHRPAGGKPAEHYRAAVREELARLGASPSIGSRSPALAAVREAPAFARQPRPRTTPTSHVTPNADVIWMTPAPRTTTSDVTWVTPAPRRWMAEVPIR
ncbi:transglycosylase SLT domain-containing protein [Halomonas sp. McH1-25]|uniref:transglycosylase SLT domain-containing protein n=1 Tax=unclassified Halomonas TaxID=2609666 RepID=UPI001EF66EDE|nr:MULTISPECIES: transglycosylase SLT domain-containing protein [unclassified Halomonas]MCG7601774.1 transglycosylase SLT domain-containing protein [Halomonas sp. McH1-25]MCP1344629.1 transglycosylase SLT domain-containing protein [Halomonas sp. FL8]MCP1363112.1 transglycosylase SLT domain-containing protein [Halomonas sp. BBD45]